MNPSGTPRVELLGSLCCVVEHLQHVHSYNLMTPFNLPSVFVPLYERGSPVDLRSVCVLSKRPLVHIRLVTLGPFVPVGFVSQTRKALTAA